MLLTPQGVLPSPIPLVLDLDGTVIRTDTFHEMMVCLLIQKPLILLRLPFWFLKGRPYAKAQLVEHTNVSPETLPYNKSLLFYAQKEVDEGRPLILATGTDQKLAQKISDYLGIFQEVIGSDGKINMTGHQKGQALIERFGLHGFDYAGDSPIDSAVWQLSRRALVVCPKWGVLKKAQVLKGSEQIHYIPREKKRPYALILALRPFFWLFNLLSLSIGICIGLSLLSSGLLVVGDLCNLEKERNGLSKKKSIFAEGHLHLLTAFMLAPLLISTSLLFIFFNSGSGVFIGLYTILFLGLDRMTRSAAPSLRWILLGLLQLLVVFVINFKLVIPTLPQ